MFEQMMRDLAFQHHNSDTAKAIDAMHGKRWRPAVPEGVPADWRPPDWKPEPRGRTPVQTRFRRLPETAERDRSAWSLRMEAGWTYQKIAEQMGYSCRQLAHKAVVRAEQDRLARGQVTGGNTKFRGDKASLVPAGERQPPRADPKKMIPKAQRAGRRGGGHLVLRGAPVAYLGRRQACLDCAMDEAGITWDELTDDPRLTARLKLHR